MVSSFLFLVVVFVLRESFQNVTRSLAFITAPSGKADSTTSPDKTVSTINDITTQGSSTKATARVQPADARRIFTGKQHTVNPSGGKVSRL
jgi:NaMN:DMB phosphoribosyltransferase